MFIAQTPQVNLSPTQRDCLNVAKAKSVMSAKLQERSTPEKGETQVPTFAAQTPQVVEGSSDISSFGIVVEHYSAKWTYGVGFGMGVGGLWMVWVVHAAIHDANGRINCVHSTNAWYLFFVIP